MKKENLLRSVLVALVLTTAVSGCAVVSGRETAGEYVDDATITTKVKTAIFNDPSLKTMQISVEPMQNVVQLSGFVDSLEIRARAGEVARGVSGVKSVRNDLVVR
jgi:hyperosmotically inducible periplasmic protein